MFFHLMKPIWKRKFKNLMLSLEIFLAFVVVFALAMVSVRYYQLYHLPTGFEYANVWSVEMQFNDSDGVINEKLLYENMKRSLAALPEVEQVAFTSYSPYSHSTWSTGYYLPDSAVSQHVNIMQMSDDAFKAMDMKLQEGRWFSAEDEGAAEDAIVINRQLATALFHGESALGKLISDSEPGKKEGKLLKVTGVFEDFRNKGEFMTPVNFSITRFSELSSKNGMRIVLLKVKPGTTRIFESKLNQTLKMVRNDLSYRITPMSDLRKSILQEDSIPLIILAVIASFLIVMVAFGLFGVLWQNTTQRIPEIGLRRAVGAHSGDIYRQIITEQMLLSSLAMIVGLLLLVQLPLTGVLGDFMNWTVFIVAALIAMLCIYGISLLCSLYPAWSASRLSPTEALHYE